MRTIAAIFIMMVSVLAFAQKPNLYAQKAHGERMDGRWTEARNILIHAVEVDSADMCCYFELARIGHWMEGEDLEKFFQLYTVMNKRIQQNRDNIEKAIDLDPENARLYYWAGKIESHFFMTRIFTPTAWGTIGRTAKQSIAYFEKAVELDPDFIEARLELVSMYRLGWLLGGSKKKMKNQLEEIKNRDIGAYTYALNLDEDVNHTLEQDSLLKAHPDNPVVKGAAAYGFRMWKYKSDTILYMWQECMYADPSDIYATNNFVRCCLKSDSVQKAKNALEVFKSANADKCSLVQSAYYKMHAGICRHQKDSAAYKTMRDKARQMDEMMMSVNSRPEYDWLSPPWGK